MNKLNGNLYTVCYGCIKINAVVRPFSNRMCFIGKTQQIVPNFHLFISIETTQDNLLSFPNETHPIRKWVSRHVSPRFTLQPQDIKQTVTTFRT